MKPESIMEGMSIICQSSKVLLWLWCRLYVSHALFSRRFRSVPVGKVVDAFGGAIFAFEMTGSLYHEIMAILSASSFLGMPVAANANGFTR
jgi:hypothetical protein